VEGNELYSSEQIQNIILNDEYSWNSLYVDLKYRFLDTEEVPFVDTMEISLDNPHTVRISVYEKGILGYLYINAIGQNAYFDKDGFVVETSTDIIDGVPKITGVSCSEVVLYEQLPLENSKVLDKLLALTQTLNKYELLPEEISYDTGLNPTLTYGDIVVEVGEDDYLNKKVVRLSEILPQLAGLKGTLHLETWTPDTTDIVFERAQ
jgi:cell division protein FtsQ